MKSEVIKMINIKVEEIRKSIFTDLKDYEILCSLVNEMQDNKELYKDVLSSYSTLVMYLIDLLMDYAEESVISKQSCWEMIEAIQYYGRDHRK